MSLYCGLESVRDANSEHVTFTTDNYREPTDVNGWTPKHPLFDEHVDRRSYVFCVRAKPGRNARPASSASPLIFSGRITPDCADLVSAMTRGVWPVGPDACWYGRVATAPKYRHRGFSTIGLAFTILFAASVGCRKVVSVYAPKFRYLDQPKRDYGMCNAPAGKFVDLDHYECLCDVGGTMIMLMPMEIEISPKVVKTAARIFSKHTNLLTASGANVRLSDRVQFIRDSASTLDKLRRTHPFLANCFTLNPTELLLAAS